MEGRARRSMKGREMFHVSVLDKPETRKAFFKFIADLKECVMAADPTISYRFLEALGQDGALLRLYTQNMDCLEMKLSLSSWKSSSSSSEIAGNPFKIMTFSLFFSQLFRRR